MLLQGELEREHERTKFSCEKEVMAEKEGFEPSYGVTHNTLSKRAVSTTHPPLRIDWLALHNWLKAQRINTELRHASTM